jgi:hypothetical protein
LCLRRWVDHFSKPTALTICERTHQRKFRHCSGGAGVEPVLYTGRPAG